TDFAQGGFNRVTGSSSLSGAPNLYGDAQTLSGHAVGGHNTLIALTPSVMYGDALVLSGNARGGGNILIGAANPFGPPFTNSNVMYGDGEELGGHASGGGNTLVSGQRANDVMWGDAAVVSAFAHTQPNTFEFAPANGHDTIMDFH